MKIEALDLRYTVAYRAEVDKLGKAERIGALTIATQWITFTMTVALTLFG